MSRIDRADIWHYWLGNLNFALCLCCKAVMIDRTDSKTWVRGHLIAHKDHGFDVYENIAPICIDCNTYDKPFHSNFHYRVYLKLMTLEEANAQVIRLKEIFTRHQNDIAFDRCVAMGCVHRRKGGSLTCGVHPQKNGHANHYIRDVIVNSRKSALEHFKLIHANKDSFDADELKEILHLLDSQIRFASNKK